MANGLSPQMRQVIGYYEDHESSEGHPHRRKGEQHNRDRAFANDVLATAFDSATRHAYQQGYEAALRERGLLGQT